MKIKKNKLGRVGSGLGEHGRCEQRSEVFLGGRSGGQDGCERKIEVFVKIPKKMGGGVGSGGFGWGVRVDVNEELKFLRQFTQKNRGGGLGGRGVRVEGVRVGGSGWM